MDTIHIQVNETAETVNLQVNEVPEIVNITVNEVLGKNGIDGAVGPTGPTGGVFTFVQAIPANPWAVNHALGYYPNVTVVDSSERIVIGDIQYIDINNLTILLCGAFCGKAHLS